MQNYTSLSFSAGQPYPEIAVQCKNPVYARWMLDNVGGSNSEMSAISLYIYNNMITGTYEDVSYIFHKISIVEMHHLNIFGKLALLLGENPRLWTKKGRRNVYWTPGYNHYPLQLAPLLLNAVNGEKAAIAKYQQQICQIDDTLIVENLKRIILDEQIHLQLYQQLYKEYCSPNTL